MCGPEGGHAGARAASGGAGFAPAVLPHQQLVVGGTVHSLAGSTPRRRGRELSTPVGGKASSSSSAQTAAATAGDRSEEGEGSSIVVWKGCANQKRKSAAQKHRIYWTPRSRARGSARYIGMSCRAPIRQGGTRPARAVCGHDTTTKPTTCKQLELPNPRAAKACSSPARATIRQAEATPVTPLCQLLGRPDARQVRPRGELRKVGIVGGLAS